MLLLLFLTVAVFTLLAVFHIYNTRNTFTTFDDFLTARNHLGTGAGAATVLASIMGAWILFSPAEAGTWGGIAAFGGYAVAQGLAMVAFAIVGPRMRKLAPKGTTLFEFIYYRYGRAMY
ncbi:MAG: Na+/proline symporter, partial [Clostridia bacterium]|nr:Na+/proline symporter [Clostridia bacterium]